MEFLVVLLILECFLGGIAELAGIVKPKPRIGVKIQNWREIFLNDRSLALS